MRRTLFRTGNSVVVSLPRDALDKLGWSEGSEVSVELDEEQGRLLIALTAPPVPGVDENFSRQLDEFIEEYRSALEALAR